MDVVGVAADVRHFGRDRPIELGIYEPLRQSPFWRESLVIKTSNDPLGSVGSVRRAVQEVDPGAPVYGIMTMEESLFRSNWRSMVLSRLLWIFSGVALVLAVTGVFGVVSFSTARRTREYGVRMALGASRRSVIIGALRKALLPCGAGLGIGLVLGSGGVRLAASLLYGVENLDLGVALPALLFLSAVVGVAVFLPARRASRANPAEVLRGD
jgi:predicted lysophospholipase L1 biosynthesis ABC-type transport system permease subunit